ncbi:MAG: hypothetical protein IKG66_03820 [Lachnospiraceae bacterium]|nr:hypothetical protein [Lachnospiraceae bacterium]
MNTRERILSIRLYERAREDPAFMRRIGVQCRQRCLRTEGQTDVLAGPVSAPDAADKEEEHEDF